jgi:hypothetical protein
MQRSNSESDLYQPSKSTLIAPSSQSVDDVQSAGAVSGAPERFSENAFIEEIASRMSFASQRSSYVEQGPKKRRSKTPPPKESGPSRLRTLFSFGKKESAEEGDAANLEESYADAAASNSITPSMQLDSFFCSELVAAALQSMDLLPPNLNVSAVWPGSFAVGGDVDKNLAAGVTYGSFVCFILMTPFLMVTFAFTQEKNMSLTAE